MKSSGKKTAWIIVIVVLLVGVIAGSCIYFGGKAIQKQKEEQALAEQEEARLLEEKQRQAADAAKLKEEEQKEQERLEAEAEKAREEAEAAKAKEEAEAKKAQEEAAKAQEEAEQQAIIEAEEEDSESSNTGENPAENPSIAPQENADAPETLPVGANGYKIAIDPGHQGQGNYDKEPIGPGASETKAKVTSGTHGAASGLDEYVLNLTVSLKLKEELLKRGYEVFMTRETHDVNISNSERAQMAADAGSDILIRIHGNGVDNTSVKGALTMAPDSDNGFLSQELISASQSLSQIVIDHFCAATGANNMGVQYYNNMSGINWSTMPVTIVEMGFMSNPEEDLLMATDDYQNKMVQGIANGIDAYFGLE